ncbi:hypothetical protein ABIE53_001021 [Burkholderia sp. OAS925]|uniref:YcgJ family protein n=1 Tax=Paraburkholderia sp. OAS925 TaxID=2663827 RepID=UPI00178AB5AF
MRMNRVLAGSLLALLLVVGAKACYAEQGAAIVRSPIRGVLCDRYMCANNKGISRQLTQRYLGDRAAETLFSQGDFSRTQFTFANGVFCDVEARVCRQDRYFDTNGKRSATISTKYTALLFGQ